MRMPIAGDARSSANILSATRSASVCASSAASGGWCSAMPLFSREARRALGRECIDAFAIVGAAPKLALGVALEIELRLERVARRSIDHLLGRGEPARRRCGKMLQQHLDLAREIGV